MRAASLALCFALVGCSTVDLGDHPPASNLLLDEDTFHCVIQPQVIEAHGCASAGCHLDSSALRLQQTEAATCEGGVAIEPIPAGSLANFTAAETFVQSDPASSPFFRAPVQMDSHPELVYEVNSEPANLVADWILDGTGL